ncbi:MAG: hypothetical protein GXP19_03660, partial [Gammaproteobacteria bacterium]|nr:hypothetical protein [Gammaproteobacteria bacterium]
QTATVNTGATQLFSATGGTAPYTWTSSNTAVASINTTTGLITAIAPGTTIINATDANNITGSSNTITVVALPAPTITVTAPATTINVGNTLQLSASGGAAPYTWSVDNPAVASIGTTNGLLSGLSAGTVVVTATDADNFTGVSISISIADPTVPALPPQIQPQTSLLPVTGTVQLNVLNGTAPFTWSTSNPATTITPIDATTIQLSTTAAGTTTVTVTDANNINATTGVIEFRAISVNSPIVSVDIGATLQITATGGRAPYTWMVNNPGIATINATGLLTGVTAGSVNVTATDVDNFSGNAVVSVITPAATIVISPQTFSLPVGNTLSFSVNGAFGGMMGAGALIWTSSDPTVATVNNFGVLTAVSSGTTVITVSDSVGNVGSTGIITVEPPPPIAVTPQTASVRAGRWLLFTATGGTGTYTWASGDSTIATIDTNGWLFGVAPGTVTVTATDSAGGNTTTGVITITSGGMHQ